MPQSRDAQGRFTSNNSNASSNGSSPVFNERVWSQMLENTSTIRKALWERLLDDRRDIDDECGYPPTGELTVQQYRRLYDREGIANRVVSLYPDESWAVSPMVFEDEDPDVSTPFEKEFDELAQTLRGNSWLEVEESHPVWEYCHRIDKLSGIGHFGVLLLGVDDGSDLEKPLDFRPGSKRRNLLFLRAFDESLVDIGTRVKDHNDPRFGQPEYYNIRFEQVHQTSGRAASLRTDSQTGELKRVHWTRVIHVADGLESNEVLAVPRIRPNYNRLYDLRKLLGGSGEMYWRGALPPLFLKSHPELGPKATIGSESKDAMENMMNTLQRWAFIAGVEPVQLAPTVVDPSKQIESQIDAICIQLGCPKRIFMGSERGELASNQDARAWNNRLAARQNRYLVPRLIAPLIDRLILIGCLSKPKSYSVVFPDMNALTEKEQAEIARMRTESIVKYIQGDGEAAMSLMDFWTTLQGLPEEIAQGIVERAMEVAREQDIEPELIEEEDGNE